MPSSMENQGVANGPAAVVAPVVPVAGGGEPAAAATTAMPGTGGVALAVREHGAEAMEAVESEAEARLNRLPMQLDVMVKVHPFRVQDLLSMEKGTVVETVHEHTQDVPLRSGGALLLWSEFEVLDQRLAVRVTRLA